MRMIRIICCHYVSQLEGGVSIGISPLFYINEFFPQSNVLLIYLRYKARIYSVKGKEMSKTISAGEVERFTEVATLIAGTVKSSGQQNQGDKNHYYQPLDCYLQKTEEALTDPLPETHDTLLERLNERLNNDYAALLKALEGDDNACNIRVTATVILALEGMKAALNEGDVTLDGTDHFNNLYNTAVAAADGRLSEMTKTLKNPVKSMVSLAKSPTHLTSPTYIGTIRAASKQSPDLPS